MPNWIILTGTPSKAAVLEAFNNNELHQLPASSSWVVSRVDTENDGDASATSMAVDSAADKTGVQDVQQILLDQSRMVLEDSQALLQQAIADETNASIPNEETQQEDSYEFDSCFPPPTQVQARGDRTAANMTVEESMVNLPSWSFSLSSITSLTALSTCRTSRINLLVCIHDLEPPVTLNLKKRSLKTGRTEAEKASMTVVDESGITFQVMMWDDYAEKWAGEYLQVGDVIYLEKIALSEYMGNKQGTATEGSKVQICYRTQVIDEKRDRLFRPDIDIPWDPICRRVKSLVQCAS
jgi:hypothetical protein